MHQKQSTNRQKSIKINERKLVCTRVEKKSLRPLDGAINPLFFSFFESVLQVSFCQLRFSVFSAF